MVDWLVRIHKGNDYYLISLTDVNADNVTFNSDGTTTKRLNYRKTQVELILNAV